VKFPLSHQSEIQELGLAELFDRIDPAGWRSREGASRSRTGRSVAPLRLPLPATVDLRTRRRLTKPPPRRTCPHLTFSSSPGPPEKHRGRAGCTHLDQRRRRADRL